MIDFHEQLDSLNVKVTALIGALQAARAENRRLVSRIERLEKDNQHTHHQLGAARQQVDQIIGQWFPESQASQEGDHGNH